MINNFFKNRKKNYFVLYEYLRESVRFRGK